MTNPIDEARDILTTHELVTAAEYRRIIAELLEKIEEARRTFDEIAK